MTAEPQLPLPPVSDGRVVDTFGVASRADLMHEHGNIERQSDEWFCPRCMKRWAVAEAAPSCK